MRPTAIASTVVVITSATVRASQPTPPPQPNPHTALRYDGFDIWDEGNSTIDSAFPVLRPVIKDDVIADQLGGLLILAPFSEYKCGPLPRRYPILYTIYVCTAGGIVHHALLHASSYSYAP